MPLRAYARWANGLWALLLHKPVCGSANGEQPRGWVLRIVAPCPTLREPAHFHHKQSEQSRRHLSVLFTNTKLAVHQKPTLPFNNAPHSLPWWGNSALASDVALAAQNKLGSQSYGGSATVSASW